MVDSFIVKRRVSTWLWFTGVLEAILIALRIALNHTPSDVTSSPLLPMVMKVAVLGFGAIFLLLVISYFVLPTLLAKREEGGRVMTSRDPRYQAEQRRNVSSENRSVYARNQPSPREAAEARLMTYYTQLRWIGAFAVVALMAGIVYVYIAKIRDSGPAPWVRLIESGSVADLDQWMESNDTPLDVQDEEGRGLLQVAIEADRVEMVRFLIEEGIDINIADRKGYVPLYYCLKNPELSGLLLENGADVNAAGPMRTTPLHEAVREGYVKTMERLFQYGARVNAVNSDAETPLIIAAQMDEYSIMNELLLRGADPNLLDKRSESPLHAAVRNKNIAGIQLLVKAGADTLPESAAGRTPLHLAAEGGSVEVLKELLSLNLPLAVKNRDGETPLSCAIYKGQLEIVKYLLEQGDYINRANVDGNSYLHLAAIYNKDDIARYLIDQGAAMDEGNKAEMTAREILQKKGKYDLAILRIEELEQEDEEQKDDAEANEEDSMEEHPADEVSVE